MFFARVLILDDGNASFYVLMCACLAIVVLLSLSFFLWLVRNRYEHVQFSSTEISKAKNVVVVVAN